MSTPTNLTEQSVVKPFVISNAFDAPRDKVWKACIVELWNMGLPVPETSPNENGVF